MLKWFRNLKIGQKEFSLIIFTSIFLIIVGLIGYYLNLKESQRLSYLYNDYLLSIQALDEIRVNTRANEADIHRLLTSNNPVEKQKLLTDIKHRAKIWNQSYLFYLTTPMEPYEVQRLPLLKSGAAKLNNLRNKSISLLQEGKIAEADKKFLALTSEIDKVNDVLSDLVNYDINKAKAVNQSNLKFVRIANLLILAAILLALIFSTILALFIAKLITDPVHNLVDRMKEIAKGNLNPPYAKISTSDEIGELNNAFDVMTDNLRCTKYKEKTAREREEFLREIILNSISTIQTNKVLRTVVTETGKRFNASRCFFIRYDNKNHNFLPIENYESYISSISSKNMSGLAFMYEELKPFLHILLLLDQRQSLMVKNIDEIEIPETTKKLFAEYNIKSFMAAPIFFREVPLGILFLDFDNNGKRVEQADIDLLSSIANQSAIVIYQTQQFHDIQTEKERAELIRKIISAVRSTLDLQEVLNTICREILDVFNADRVSIENFPYKDNYSQWTVNSRFFAKMNG